MPAHSDIPPGLSPEEKKAYIRERNRLKQARLRARRNEKIKHLEDKVALAEAAKLFGSSDQSTASSSSRGGSVSGDPVIAALSERFIAPSVSPERDLKAAEVLLHGVVIRMTERLVQLGVGEDELRQLTSGELHAERRPSLSPTLPTAQRDSLHANVPSFKFGASPPSPSSLSSGSSSSTHPYYNQQQNHPSVGLCQSTSTYSYPYPASTTSMADMALSDDPSWKHTLFEIHTEAYKLRRERAQVVAGGYGGRGQDWDGMPVVDESALAGIQLSILRLLASSAPQHLASYAYNPTPEEFRYLATQRIDERIGVLPCGPGVKVALAKAVASGSMDLTDAIAEIIESAVVRGDVFDHSVDQFGYSLPLPLTFFAAHPCLLPFVPRDMVEQCSPYVPPSPFPTAGSSGMGRSIREIVLGMDLGSVTGESYFPHSL